MTVTDSTDKTKETPEEMNDSLDMAETPIPTSWERAVAVLTEPFWEFMATLLLAGVLALVMAVAWELGGR